MAGEKGSSSHRPNPMLRPPLHPPPSDAVYNNDAVYYPSQRSYLVEQAYDVYTSGLRSRFSVFSQSHILMTLDKQETVGSPSDVAERLGRLQGLRFFQFGEQSGGGPVALFLSAAHMTKLQVTVGPIRSCSLPLPSTAVICGSLVARTAFADGGGDPLLVEAHDFAGALDDLQFGQFPPLSSQRKT